MELYFFRHGPAGWAGEWHGGDADRPLTDKGRILTERVGLRLAEAGVGVDLIVTSPYARALQTAEIVAEALGTTSRLELDDQLQPGFDLSALGRILERWNDVGRLMLVGHEPSFSTVIGQLIGSADLVIKKSSIAMVEVPDPPVARGTLRMLVPPSLLA
jgi:phosphohistidine phosphatase